MKTFSVIIGILCGVVSILLLSWTPLIICFCIIIVCTLLQLSENVAAIGRPDARAEQARTEQARTEQARTEPAKAEPAKAEPAKAADGMSEQEVFDYKRYFLYHGYEN